MITQKPEEKLCSWSDSLQMLWFRPGPDLCDQQATHEFTLRPIKGHYEIVHNACETHTATLVSRILLNYYDGVYEISIHAR